MSTDLLTRKINRHFDLIDTDGNGRIEQQDFDLIVTRLSDQFGQAPGSPKHTELSKAYRGMWEGLRSLMDTDGDGAISREEYTAGLRADAATGEGYRQLVRPVAKAIIGLCDLNGDGRLDGEELAKAHIAMGMEDKDHEAAMSRLDLDGDGFISEDELAQAIEQFFLSEDEDAAGNWLFGKI